MFTAYQLRLLCSGFVSLLVMMAFYGMLYRGSGASSVERISNPNAILSEPQGNACPNMPALYSSPGKPVWVAGYPGSGFDFLAPIIATVTGLTASDVYRHHTCSVPVKEGAAITGACMTHWPLVQKDSPVSLALNGDKYSPRAIFVIRNPANAIPGYFTRWWGAQRHVQGNHQQPPESEWKAWRDERFERHLKVWKRSLLEWQRGIPAAGLTGIALYIPFEDLINAKHGPHLTEKLAQVFEEFHHQVAEKPQCLWRKSLDRQQLHKAKAYDPKFTSGQVELLLQTLDDLLELYEASEPQLATILQGYRSDIQENVRLDND